MDIESFEPSDESMENIEEHLKKLREQRINTANRQRFRIRFGGAVSDELPHKPLTAWILRDPTNIHLIIEPKVLEADSAYKRSLRHEELLHELEELGLKKWEALGHRAEFETLTRQAIEIGREDALTRKARGLRMNDEDDHDQTRPHDHEQADALICDWYKALESLNSCKHKGVYEHTFRPFRGTCDWVSPSHRYCNVQEGVKVEVQSPVTHRAPRGYALFPLASHAPLPVLIEHHGVHAEVEQTKSGPKVYYEALENNRQVNQGQ